MLPYAETLNKCPGYVPLHSAFTSNGFGLWRDGGGEGRGRGRGGIGFRLQMVRNKRLWKVLMNTKICSSCGGWCNPGELYDWQSFRPQMMLLLMACGHRGERGGGICKQDRTCMKCFELTPIWGAACDRTEGWRVRSGSAWRRLWPHCGRGREETVRSPTGFHHLEE
jgi:hypothetical protein